MVLISEEGSGNRKKGGRRNPVFLLLLFLFSCGDQRPPEEFRVAFDALNRALAKERLEASAFAPRFPHPTAKQVISYICSEAGTEVLQVSATALGEDIDSLSDVPVWPSHITLWHTTRQPYGKRLQVILVWNDEAGIVQARAFSGENPEPVYRNEWKIQALTAKNAIDPTDTREFQAF